MPLSVRLDPKTEAAIKRLARRHKRTQSAVVREAVAVYARDEAAHPPEPSTPWEALKHLVGVVNTGRSRRSEHTGEGFRALVRKKARARRAR